MWEWVGRWNDTFSQCCNWKIKVEWRCNIAIDLSSIIHQLNRVTNINISFMLVYLTLSWILNFFCNMKQLFVIGMWLRSDQRMQSVRCNLITAQKLKKKFSSSLKNYLHRICLLPSHYLFCLRSAFDFQLFQHHKICIDIIFWILNKYLCDKQDKKREHR